MYIAVAHINPKMITLSQSADPINDLLGKGKGGEVLVSEAVSCSENHKVTGDFDIACRT